MRAEQWEQALMRWEELRSRFPDVPAGYLRAAEAARQLVRHKEARKLTLVHHVAMKPSIYGSVAAWISGGVGVNLERFHMVDEPPGIPVVTMVSRLLWSKGVREFFEAARILKEQKVAVRFMLVGTPDADNPDSVPEETLRDWDKQGFLKWAGHREDIPEVWKSSHIAVLPSFYREGIPRSLLEAAACGKPIITTDMPGCREAVIPGKSGMLIPIRNSVALAIAIEKLVSDPVTRRSMGRASREIAEKEFSEERVVGETTGIYREIILASQWSL